MWLPPCYTRTSTRVPYTTLFRSGDGGFVDRPGFHNLRGNHRGQCRQQDKGDHWQVRTCVFHAGSPSFPSRPSCPRAQAKKRAARHAGRPWRWEERRVGKGVRTVRYRWWPLTKKKKKTKKKQ